MNLGNVIDVLPPYEGREKLVKKRQDTYDIITEIMKMHRKTAGHYDRIPPSESWKGDARATAENLFDFCKRNIGYAEEPALEQTVKTPSAILAEGKHQGGDCKHYASIIVGTCEALRRRGYPIKAFYRFASYRVGEKHPGHVFAVVMGKDGREIWVDPAIPGYRFDVRNPNPTFIIDKTPPDMNSGKIGALYTINGIDTGLHAQRHPHHLSRRIPGGTEYIHSGPAHQHRGHWLDTMPGRMNGDEMGKLNLKKAIHNIHAPHLHLDKKLHLDKIKVPHIKIKAPHIKLPKHLGAKIAFTAARNAYLALLKVNALDFAVQLHNKVVTKPNAWKALHDLWENKLGGNANKLSTAINQGVSHYNSMHKGHHVSGMGMYKGPFSNGYMVGVAPVAAAAGLLAAAAPVIAAVTNILKSFGIDVSAHKDAADKATEHLKNAHNEGTPNDDGSVTHDDGTVTKVETDAQGNPTAMTITPPSDAGDGGGGGSSSSAAADDDGEDDDKGSKVPAKKDDSVTSALSTWFQDKWEFVKDHKWYFIGGAAVLIGVPILISVVRGGTTKTKTRRRR